MRSIITSILLLALLVSLPGRDAEAQKIRGELLGESPESFKVLAVNRDSKSVVATVAANGKFSIRVKKNSTLHLVSNTGKYAGPLGAAKGSKFYPNFSGVKGDLGKITRSDGFATVKYTGRRRALFNRKKVSFDPDTGPLGAGKFGLVLSPVSGASVRARGAKIAANENDLGEDLDRDGIPDLLDIDDDGDLALDIVDPVEHASSEFNAEIASTLRLELTDTLNINIGNVTEEQIDAALEDNLRLLMLIQSGETRKTISTVDVDCGSLSYCSSSGTATIDMDTPPITNGSLWTAYDPNGDGYPNLGENFNRPEINVKPHATRAQIGTGDTIFFRLTTSGGEQVLPAVVPFVFVTSPALKSWSDGSTTTVSYPVSAGDPGTQGNPFTLTSQQVTLTFWKPQRDAIEGAEAPGFIDMGGLQYGVYLSIQGDSTPYTCALADFTGLSSTLQHLATVNGAQALEDTASDAAADTSNTLAFTLDLGACLTRNSVDPTGKSVMIDLTATSDSQDQSSQSFHFQLP